MKLIILASLVVLCCSSIVLSEDKPPSPIEVVNKRMTSYNAHDLESFLSTYAEGVQVYKYPDSTLSKGKLKIKKLFEPMFKEGFVHVEIHSQILKDTYVVNHETVKYPNETIEYVSIYKVVDGLIVEVRFVRD